VVLSLAKVVLQWVSSSPQAEPAAELSAGFNQKNMSPNAGIGIDPANRSFDDDSENAAPTTSMLRLPGGRLTTLRGQF
jgi:hypothetical protein